MSKRPKKECEICGENNKAALQRHHIVEQTEINTDNSDWNLAVICANCHTKVHDESIRIIGVFPSTANESGKKLIYVKDGVCNVPGMENEQPHYIPKPQSMRIR